MKGRDLKSEGGHGDIDHNTVFFFLNCTKAKKCQCVYGTVKDEEP